MMLKFKFNKLLIIIFILTISTAYNYCQTKTNLEIFYNLVDSSVVDIVTKLPAENKTATIKLNLGSEYGLFGNHFITQLKNSGVIVKTEKLNSTEVDYVIDNAKVDYGDIFRSGFLGDFYLPREVTITGNYLLSNNQITPGKFTYTYRDSVKVDEVEEIENNSFPFTKGNVPSEPFFSGLLEPVIAVATAAVAVFLFFTVRSK